MSDYVLEVHYGEDDEPVRVPLVDCDPDDAEVERQALVSRIEHAHDINAPEIFATDTPPGSDIAIDPARVTSVDLVEPDDADPPS
jgi:hypothetical protein